MKNVLVFFLALLILAGCNKVPVTGRSQLDIVPNSEILSMSATSYKQFLDTSKLSTNTEKTAMVKRVGGKIAVAVETYLKNNGFEKEIKDYKWEFNLVESNEINAWCMPGGKVVVYTGILKLAPTDGDLAVVMGHEIAHAVARHGNERMSQGLIQQFGGMALQVALASKPAATQNLFLGAYGMGSQVGILLPFSRKQEAEADHLGLIFMAMAGYDPRAAVGFWQKMSAQGKSGTPEFLSTHPSDATRIAKIQEELPEALKYYNQTK